MYVQRQSTLLKHVSIYTPVTHDETTSQCAAIQPNNMSLDP